ncbi:DUF6232 family protein [Streptomyces platensis]|uniref:DUF6232 family protein n=1 Tax=Streptomyces platensis TaxID=58346 RepID=UPI00386550A5|nr:DUF6232 family protein [Streptomyces platensis]
MTSTDPAEQSWNPPAADRDTHGSPPPAAPPPPPAAPPQPPVGPSPAADPYPDVAPAASGQSIIGVDLRVSKRLLWVGDAYYPLQNVARVYTLTIHPRRKEAVVLFVKRLLLLGVATVLLLLLAATNSGFGSSGDDSGGVTALVVIAAGAALVYSLVEMLKVLSAPPHFVLAVETTGPSTAVVTSPDPDQLRRLAHQIAHAIENPAAEFTVRVNTVTVSPKHYYFGDNVNMYGGTGNVGMAS